MSSFSQRHGYSGPLPGTLVREDAPHSLRVTVLNAAQMCYMNPFIVRDTICRVLRTRAAAESLTIFEQWHEAERLLQKCWWYKVYDIIEALSEVEPFLQAEFAKEINDCCIEEGIGWQLVNGKVVARGDDIFQEAIETAAAQLKEQQRPTAASHIQSAVKALSERPRANTPGAVFHATNAVECLLHDITGQAMTLGKYLDKYSGLFHPSLKKTLDGLYGFASDAGARHGKEGIEPGFYEAQFSVQTCAAACSLLTANHPKADDGR